MPILNQVNHQPSPSDFSPLRGNHPSLTTFSTFSTRPRSTPALQFPILQLASPPDSLSESPPSRQATGPARPAYLCPSIALLCWGRKGLRRRRKGDQVHWCPGWEKVCCGGRWFLRPESEYGGARRQRAAHWTWWGWTIAEYSYTAESSIKCNIQKNFRYLEIVQRIWILYSSTGCKRKTLV